MDRISIIIITIVMVSIFYVNKNGLCADITEIESDYYQQDEFAGHVHKPYAKREYTWPEHPRGKIILKTNNLGFREDSDTQITKSKGTIRILVTGDSQIDGVVYNEESMPNVLEKKLNSLNQTTKFEVINGGVGYYGTDHYFLFLNKQLVLKPDAYIVVIYSGNDFLDMYNIMKGHQAEFFWKKDYHLNVQGHSFLAERIYEIFGNRLASHKTKRFFNLY